MSLRRISRLNLKSHHPRATPTAKQSIQYQSKINLCVTILMLQHHSPAQCVVYDRLTYSNSDFSTISLYCDQTLHICESRNLAHLYASSGEKLEYQGASLGQKCEN